MMKYQLSPDLHRSLRGPLVAAMGVLLAIMLGACAGGAATASPDAEAVCADAADLQTSVDELKGLDLTAVGTDGLTTAVGDVQAASTALKASASAALQPSVSALETSVAALKTAVDQVGEGEVGAAADEIAAAVAGVETAAKAVQTELQASACPG